MNIWLSSDLKDSGIVLFLRVEFSFYLEKEEYFGVFSQLEFQMANLMSDIL